MFWRRRKSSDFSAEIDAHIQHEAERLSEQGMGEEEARAGARRAFGNVMHAEERFYESHGWLWWDHLKQDLRFGFRTLRKSPRFTAAVVLTLGLGVGANTAIFSVVNAVLLRSLPFKAPEQLVLVWNRGAEAAGGDHTPLAVSDLLDWGAQSRSFADVGAFQTSSFNYVDGGSPEWVQAANVTANFFTMLGIQPELGRNFLPDDDRPGAQRVALLSDGFWRSRLASDPNVVGHSISLDGDIYAIVGIVPPIDFPSKDVVVWTTLQLKPPTRRGPYFLTGMGRLKSDVSLQTARAEIDTIKASFPSGQAKANGQQFDFNVLPINEVIVGDVRLALLVLSAAVTLVLLIATVNVANLMLVRSAQRIREMSLRAALGASRWRITRQLLTESALLAVASGVLGVLLATGGVCLLLKLAPDTIPNLNQIGVDERVLAWAALISVLAGVFFGLAPAWQSARLNLDEGLKEGGGRMTTESASKRHWRSLLVVSELSLAMMLLASAGLVIKSFWRLERVDSGVSAERILTMQLQFAGPRYAKPQQLDTFCARLLERIEALPGVRVAAISNSLPPDTTDYSDVFEIEGRPADASLPPQIAYMIFVSSEYFRTFGIPLRRGRLFTSSDSPNGQRVAIISETTARQFFPHEDPLGKRLKEKGEIVGVVADVRYTGLAEAIQPAIYEPLGQAHAWGVLLSVKTDVADPTSLSSAVRAELASLDPELPLSRVGTLDYRFANAVAQPRFRTTLIALFAAIAVVLAVVGTYGVISYSVAQRTHEIGVRMALGAQPDGVSKLVLKEGVGLTVAGLLTGLCGSFALTGLLRNLLFNVSATDAPTFGEVAVVLAAAALLACYIPARRATRVDPIVALRHE